jgi:hypothetical protein
MGQIKKMIAHYNEWNIYAIQSNIIFFKVKTTFLYNFLLLYAFKMEVAIVFLRKHAVEAI